MEAFTWLKNTWLRSDHVVVVDLEIYMSYEVVLEYWRASEDKHLIFLDGHSNLDHFLLDMHALELHMCHLELGVENVGLFIV